MASIERDSRDGSVAEIIAERKIPMTRRLGANAGILPFLEGGSIPRGNSSIQRNLARSDIYDANVLRLVAEMVGQDSIPISIVRLFAVFDPEDEKDDTKEQLAKLLRLPGTIEDVRMDIEDITLEGKPKKAIGGDINLGDTDACDESTVQISYEEFVALAVAISDLLPSARFIITGLHCALSVNNPGFLTLRSGWRLPIPKTEIPVATIVVRGRGNMERFNYNFSRFLRDALSAEEYRELSEGKRYGQSRHVNDPDHRLLESVKQVGSAVKAIEDAIFPVALRESPSDTWILGN